jgi:recombination protein RecA
MAISLQKGVSVWKAARLHGPNSTGHASAWTFASLGGLLSELSEEVPSGATSFAADLIVEAQAQGEPVAWIAGRNSIFYPPDFAESGVDLDGVTVVWAKGAAQSMLAVDQLLRSRAFGLIIVDLGTDWSVSDSALGRFARLAELHASAVVFLTVKLRDEQSIGSMISLRGTVSSESHLSSTIRTIKDKHGATITVVRRDFDAPPGMH